MVGNVLSKFLETFLAYRRDWRLVRAGRDHMTGIRIQIQSTEYCTAC